VSRILDLSGELYQRKKIFFKQAPRGGAIFLKNHKDRIWHRESNAWLEQNREAAKEGHAREGTCFLLGWENFDGKEKNELQHLRKEKIDYLRKGKRS